MDHWYTAKNTAEQLVHQVVLVERPFSPEYRAADGYKHYDVHLDGKVLGSVLNGDETIERRTPGKRYVNARWTRKCWIYDSRDTQHVRMCYQTRKKAMLELLTRLVHTDKLA